MFRIELFVEDKNLAGVMHALAGRALDLKVVPVVNASKARHASGGNAAASASVQAKTEGDTVQVLRAGLYEPGRAIRAHDVKVELARMGRNASSYSYYLQEMIRRGLLKRHPGKGTNGMTYTFVTGAKS